LSDQGEPEAAIPHARRWVSLDPLHEPAQRRLIQLYDRSGQPAAALRQYEEFVKLLEEALGLPPEEETASMETPVEEESAASGMETIVPKTGADQPPPVQTEPTQTEQTAEAKPQPELSKQPPEEPTQKSETKPAPKRSEEAQKFIDMVETGAAKTWQWIKEGSKSLWDRAADLF